MLPTTTTKMRRFYNDYTTPGIDTLEELAQKHYPTHTGKKKTIYPDVSITKQELLTRYNDWINEEKITAAFKGFESKKSPGPDGLKPITLKHLPKSMTTSIKMIYKLYTLPPPNGNHLKLYTYQR